MARDLFAENGIDPDVIRGTKKVSQGTSAPANDPFAANNIDPEVIRQQSQKVTHPLGNIFSGIATAGQNVHNLLTPKSMNTNYDFSDLFGKPTKGDIARQKMAAFLPAMALPGIGEGALGEAATQAAYGASQSPDNRALGAALGAGGVGAGAAMGKAANMLRPSQMFRGKLTPEQLSQNLKETQGTTTGLGDVIGSPTLKRAYENVLPHVSFAGATDAMQGTAAQITKKGNDILEEIGNSLPEGDHGKLLQNALKEASNEARAEKNANFEEVNNLADKEGLTVGRTNFQNAAKDALKNINQSQELKSEFPSDFYQDLQRYAGQPKTYLGSNAIMNNKEQSLKLSNIFKGVLRDKAQDFYDKGQMNNYGIAKNLQNSLDQDIQETINSSASPHLLQAYEKAQDNYRTKFAQFEDPDIVKFTRQGGDSDLLLNHFVRKGQADRGQLLQKLTNKLSPTSRYLPAYAYLSKASGNPLQMAKLYRDLGDKQRVALFPDKEIREKLENYSNLVGKNTEAFKTMANPATGQRSLDTLTQLTQMLGGFHAGGVPGVIGGFAAPALGGRLATHLLTNPQIRQNLVNKMIQNKPWETDPKVLRALSAALGSSK